MVTFATPTQSTGKLPAGEYIMRLKDIDNSEKSKWDPSIERLKFIFEVLDVESIDEYPADIDEKDDDAVAEYESTLTEGDHWAWCDNKMGGNATLRKWLTGMLGRTIGKNEVPDPAEVIGKTYKVTLGMVSYTFNGESGEKFDIALIKPYKAPRQRTRPTEKPDPWDKAEAEGFDDE
jgi:hypothetical protein